MKRYIILLSLFRNIHFRAKKESFVLIERRLFEFDECEIRKLIEYSINGCKFEAILSWKPTTCIVDMDSLQFRLWKLCFALDHRIVDDGK